MTNFKLSAIRGLTGDVRHPSRQAGSATPCRHRQPGPRSRLTAEGALGRRIFPTKVHPSFHRHEIPRPSPRGGVRWSPCRRHVRCHAGRRSGRSERMLDFPLRVGLDADLRGRSARARTRRWGCTEAPPPVSRESIEATHLKLRRSAAFWTSLIFYLDGLRFHHRSSVAVSGPWTGPSSSKEMPGSWLSHYRMQLAHRARFVIENWASWGDCTHERGSTNCRK